MRLFGSAIVCFLFMPPLAGCATLPRQDKTAALELPAITDALRVRILYTRASSKLSSTGSFQYQSRRGGKIYTMKSSVRLRAMRSTIVIGEKSLKGEVLVLSTTSSDTIKLNGRRYRGYLVIHPLGSGRYDIVEYVNLDEYLYGVLHAKSNRVGLWNHSKRRRWSRAPTRSPIKMRMGKRRVNVSNKRVGSSLRRARGGSA